MAADLDHGLGDELKTLWKDMAELTKPLCGTCRVPWSCCSPEYCEMAIEIAKEEWGEELPRTGHPRLPLMGPEGCTAPPHTRPMCTLHVCEGTLMKSSLVWTKKYFKLREKLAVLEHIRKQVTE